MTKELRSYEDEVLSVLAYEFTEADHTESERKIKRRLRDKKLGAYDQTRIESLRAFKDDISHELGRHVNSAFHTGSHGKYADMNDWDFEGLLKYFKQKHTEVPESAIGGFLPFAIFIYYLR